MGRPCKCCGNCPCIKYAHRYLIDSDPSSEWISLDGSTTIDWQNEDLFSGGSGSILISSEDTNSLNYSFISRDSFCNGVDLFWEFDYDYQIKPGDYYNVRIGTTDGTDGLLLTFKKIQPTSNTCEPEDDQDLIQATIEFNGEILYSETLVEFLNGTGKLLYNFSDDASKIFPQGCAPETWITTFANLCYRNDISTLIFNNYFIEDIVLPGDKISFEFVFQQPEQVVGFRDLMFRDVEGSKSLISPFLSNFNPQNNICTSQCIECEACWERVWSYSETGKHQFCDEKRFDTEYSTSETSATIISTEAHPWFGSNYDPPWASFCSINYSAGVTRNFDKEGYARLYLNTNSPNSGTFTGMEIKQLDEPIGTCTHGVYFQYGKDDSVNYEQLVYYFRKIPCLTEINPFCNSIQVSEGLGYFPINGFYFEIIQTYDGKIRFYSYVITDSNLILLLSFDLVTGDEKWYHEINENTSGAFVSATIQGLLDPLVDEPINPWEGRAWTVTHKMLHPDGPDTNSEEWGTSSKSLLQGACESDDVPSSIFYDPPITIPTSLVGNCLPDVTNSCISCSDENASIGVTIGGQTFICQSQLTGLDPDSCRWAYNGTITNCGLTNDCIDPFDGTTIEVDERPPQISIDIVWYIGSQYDGTGIGQINQWDWRLTITLGFWVDLEGGSLSACKCTYFNRTYTYNLNSSDCNFPKILNKTAGENALYADLELAYGFGPDDVCTVNQSNPESSCSLLDSIVGAATLTLS